MYKHSLNSCITTPRQVRKDAPETTVNKIGSIGPLVGSRRVASSKLGFLGFWQSTRSTSSLDGHPSWTKILDPPYQSCGNSGWKVMAKWAADHCVEGLQEKAATMACCAPTNKYIKLLVSLPSVRSTRESNVFTGMCLSTGGRGMSLTSGPQIPGPLHGIPQCLVPDPFQGNTLSPVTGPVQSPVPVLLEGTDTDRQAWGTSPQSRLGYSEPGLGYPHTQTFPPKTCVLVKQVSVD